MYCSGHARVKENDQADRLAGKAAITSSLCLGRSEMQMLRCFRHCLWVQSQAYHIIYCLEERGVARGSAWRSSLKGPYSPQRLTESTENGTVPKAIPEQLLRDRMEHAWAFLSAQTPSWTALNYLSVCYQFQKLLSTTASTTTSVYTKQ